jgi:hypothetical protein
VFDTTCQSVTSALMSVYSVLLGATRELTTERWAAAARVVDAWSSGRGHTGARDLVGGVMMQWRLMQSNCVCGCYNTYMCKHRFYMVMCLALLLACERIELPPLHSCCMRVWL